MVGLGNAVLTTRRGTALMSCVLCCAGGRVPPNLWGRRVWHLSAEPGSDAGTCLRSDLGPARDTPDLKNFQGTNKIFRFLLENVIFWLARQLYENFQNRKESVCYFQGVIVTPTSHVAGFWLHLKVVILQTPNSVPFCLCLMFVGYTFLIMTDTKWRSWVSICQTKKGEDYIYERKFGEVGKKILSQYTLCWLKTEF